MNRLANLYAVIVKIVTGLFQAIEFLSRPETREAIDAHAVTVSRAAVRLAEFHRRNGHLVADMAGSLQSAIETVEKARDKLVADLAVIGEKAEKNERNLNADMEEIFNSSKPSTPTTVKVTTAPAKKRGRPRKQQPIIVRTEEEAEDLWSDAMESLRMEAAEDPIPSETNPYES